MPRKTSAIPSTKYSRQTRPQYYSHTATTTTRSPAIPRAYQQEHISNKVRNKNVNSNNNAAWTRQARHQHHHHHNVVSTDHKIQPSEPAAGTSIFTIFKYIIGFIVLIIGGYMVKEYLFSKPPPTLATISKEDEDNLPFEEWLDRKTIEFRDRDASCDDIVSFYTVVKKYQVKTNQSDSNIMTMIKASAEKAGWKWWQGLNFARKFNSCNLAVQID